jgi:transposase
VEAQVAALDKRIRSIVGRSDACWRLTSVPGVGPVAALAFLATVENPTRFRRPRDIGAYLGLTPKRYQSGERDVSGSISRQGDAMARHYLYEAAILHHLPGTLPVSAASPSTCRCALSGQSCGYVRLG